MRLKDRFDFFKHKTLTYTHSYSNNDFENLDLYRWIEYETSFNEALIG